jgi:hypothetical protein
MPWQAVALLRPGLEVIVLDVSRWGALLESDARMLPGSRAELQLFGELRRLVRGRIVRCFVASLSPLRYRGAVAFEEALPVDTQRG